MLQNGAESATMDSIEPVLGARCTVAGAPKPEAPTVAATNSLGERFFVVVQFGFCISGAQSTRRKRK